MITQKLYEVLKLFSNKSIENVVLKESRRVEFQIGEYRLLGSQITNLRGSAILSNKGNYIDGGVMIDNLFMHLVNKKHPDVKIYPEQPPTLSSLQQEIREVKGMLSKGKFIRLKGDKL